MAVSVYLDASVLVPLFIEDAFTERASRYFESTPIGAVVSDFGETEFASAISRKVRTGDIGRAEARTVFDKFDMWTLRSTSRVDIAPSDIAFASASLRRLDLTLRTADAINIAIAWRIGTPIATFDVKMAASARDLGVEVVAI